MPTVPLDGLSFSGWAWTFELSRKHTETSTQHAGSFASTF